MEWGKYGLRRRGVREEGRKGEEFCPPTFKKLPLPILEDQFTSPCPRTTNPQALSP